MNFGDEFAWMFEFLYHRDRMNAAAHCARTRWSVLTIRVARTLEAALDREEWSGAPEVEARVREVAQGED